MNPAKPATAIGSAPVIAISGGKGGVGKSTLALNLGVALSAQGRRVLLIDGDLSLANLDVLLGLTPDYNIEHLIRDETSLRQVLVEGPRGLQLLPAASGVPDLAGLEGGIRDRLLSTLSSSVHDVDQMIVDTGAGLGRTTLALQLAASRVVLVTTPEPTSLVDAYATLKVLWAADPAKPVDLVVNGADDEPQGYEIYRRLSSAAQRFLGATPGWLGPVLQDPHVVESVRRQSCLIEFAPDSPAAICYERIASVVAAPQGMHDCGAFWRQLERSYEKETTH